MRDIPTETTEFVGLHRPSETTLQRGRFTAFIGIALIVGFPTCFWLLVAELAVPLFGWEYGATERLVIAGFVIVVTGVVWSVLQISDTDDDGDYND